MSKINHLFIFADKNSNILYNTLQKEDLAMKNNNTIIIITILSVIIIALGGYIIYDKFQVPDNKDNTDNSGSTQTINNIQIDPEADECKNGCQKTLTINGQEETIYASEKELKLGNKTIINFDEGEASFINQVNVYNDIIITMDGFSLGRAIHIYDLNGNLIKTINDFKDEQGRLFTSYPGYSNSDCFSISDDGKIEFLGTKHTQGAANTYILDSGDVVDLCSQPSIKDDDIVSGIFEITYLGNYQFSDIKYLRTKKTVKDIKNCY